MDAAGIGNWGAFGQLVTVIAAALAAVYIIVDNVRKSNEDQDDNSQTEIKIEHTPVNYPPTWGIFGRVFQCGRPYFGSRSPLRSIWEVRDDVDKQRSLVFEETDSCQTEGTKIVSGPSPSAASTDKITQTGVESPPEMDSVWFGDRNHDDAHYRSILDEESRLVLPVAVNSYLTDLCENMDTDGNDVMYTSDRCTTESHARLQRLLERDMERQARKTYMHSDDSDRIRERMKCGRQKWLQDIEKDWEQFNVEVCVENEPRYEWERMPAIPERNAVEICSSVADNARTVSVEATSPTAHSTVSSVAAVHSRNEPVQELVLTTKSLIPATNRHFFLQESNPSKRFIGNGVNSFKQPKYREFSLLRQDTESSRQVPLLGNGDDRCLLLEDPVDDSLSSKTLDKYSIAESTNENSVSKTTVVAWETPKHQTVMSPNRLHPGSQSAASEVSSDKDVKRSDVVKPPIPPSSLTLSNKSESSRRLFKARQQFFENLCNISNDKTSDCVQKLRRFQQSTRADRYRLASSTPDLKLLEEKIRSTLLKSIPIEVTPKSKVIPPVQPAWPQISKRCLVKRYSKSVGYLETDIDTLESRTVQETSLNYNHSQNMLTVKKKPEEFESRTRSVDYLVSSGNKTPENPLGRTKSEYEIRFEKSLQNLQIPEWYKQSKWSHTNKDGFLLKKKRDKGWQGLRSRATSTLSMTNLNHRSSKGGMRSAGESPTSSTGSLSRWSSAKLSTASGPVFSWNVYRSNKQPYLGWRASSTQSPTSSNQSIGSTPTSPDPSCDSTSRKVLRFLGQEVPVVASLQDVTEVIDKSELEEEKSPGAQSDKLDIPRDRYSYIESIFNSDSCIPQHSCKDRGKFDKNKILWIESSFVGKRATTSVAVARETEEKPIVQNGSADDVWSFKEKRITRI